MLTNSYRMGEYKIIEYNSGELTWEAHRGFGGLQKGGCFRKGSILFIGPPETDEPGFLKREFLEHLKPLPVWSKTKYYCKRFDVYHCRTHKRVTIKEMRFWAFDPDHDRDNILERKEHNDAVYRLLGYEISSEGDNRITWKTSSGPSGISRGKCTISEGILFIGPKESMETGVSSRRFVYNLKNLPEWDHTTYYSTKTSLCNSNAEFSEKKQRKTWPTIRRKAAKNSSGKHPKKHMELKMTDSRLWATHTAHFSSWVKKNTIQFIILVALITSFTFSYLIGWCKAQKPKLDRVKKRNHSV